MMYVDESSDCCSSAKDIILYRNKNTFCGPVKDGWSIIENVYVGSPTIINITYCPFCGIKLPDEPKIHNLKKK